MKGHVFEQVVGVGVVVSAIAAVIAAATIVALLTDPLGVTAAVDSRDISSLVLRLAGVIYDVIVGLLAYL